MTGLMKASHHDLKDGLRRLIVRLRTPRNSHRPPEQLLEAPTSKTGVVADDGIEEEIEPVCGLSMMLRLG
ncbi:hypothetical protein NL676_030007 [Syzygium grande]|nr:hypothetical protein NL676_030007 [Syzygium grande]